MLKTVGFFKKIFSTPKLASSIVFLLSENDNTVFFCSLCQNLKNYLSLLTLLYIYIQFSLFSKYSLNLAIGPTSTADITTIVWILYRPLSCFHSGKHICLYSTQPEWPFKYWYVSSHVTLLLKTLQKIPNSFRVNSIDFVIVFEILHDLFSSPLPLWSSFTADFPSLSLGHLLLPQGLCTFAAGSSLWHFQVLFPLFKGLIRNSFPDYSSSYSTPKHSHSLITYSLIYDFFFPY